MIQFNLTNRRMRKELKRLGIKENRFPMSLASAKLLHLCLSRNNRVWAKKQSMEVNIK